MNFQKLENFADKAAKAHGIHVSVSSVDHVDENDNFTGLKVIVVRFEQEVWFAPEDQSGPSAINNRRLIGISRGDARRLYKSRKGRPGGQAYIGSRSAQHAFSIITSDVENGNGIQQLLHKARAGEFRAAAHDVADQAAQIEVEMRMQLRSDLEAIQ